MGGLKPNETVLIHSAGDAVGIAAIYTAKHMVGSSEPHRPQSTANCARSASIT
jgi:NADPH:quinone reductase-like Zn-dependent oxidoreductase